MMQSILGGLEALMRASGIKRHVWKDGRWTLSYHAYGLGRRGQTLVLVHGLGASSLTWIKVLRALGKKHRVYAIDLPTWGFSPVPQNQTHASVADMTAALIEFLEHVVKRPAVVVGESMGGWVSAKAAAARPDLVDRLVLVNNAGVLYPEVVGLRERLNLKTTADVRAFWRDLWHRTPLLYRPFARDFVAKMQEPRVIGFLDSIGAPDFINDDLATMRVPTSIIWGMNDRFIPIQTVDVMMGLLPETTVHWIPDCGHIPGIERPKEFLRILHGILSDSPRSPEAATKVHEAPEGAATAVGVVPDGSSGRGMS